MIAKTLASKTANEEDENLSDANEQSLKFNMDDIRAMQMQIDCVPLNT